MVVAVADRGLAGGFNSSIVRAARTHISRLLEEGKDVKILGVGRKARDPLRRLYRERLIDTYDLSAERNLTLSVAQPIAERILELFEAAKPTWSPCSSAGSGRWSPRSRSPAADPGRGRRRRPADRLKGAIYEYEPEEETILESCCPATSPSRCSPPCWRTWPASSPPR